MDVRAEAIVANISSFLMEMGRAGGGEERRDDEIAWTIGGSPIGYHNAVVQCDATPERADMLIEEWAAALRGREVPGSWHVSPFMNPRDLAERLAAQGFEDGGEEPAMAVDLTTAPLECPPEYRPPQRFAIERVRDDPGLEAYRQVLGRGFGEGPREADWVADVFRRIGLSDKVPWRHYVGSVAGEPASTATMFLTPGIAGIYFVSTSPDARRRGIGAATTRHAMLEARELGCSTAVLGSSTMSHSLYRRLGFEDVFRYRMLELSPGGTDSEPVT